MRISQHRIAERVGRDVIVADRPQDEPGAGAIEEPPDADDQREREIDEGVLAEQDAADQRNVGQDRDVKMRRRRDALADEAGADQAGQADAENRQREPGGHLVDREAQRQQREDQRTAARPATMPHSAPTMIEPVSQAPAKPQAAPMIIMPSTPRLSTPERSATSSPAAASSSGVEAASTERMMASSSSTGHLP